MSEEGRKGMGEQGEIIRGYKGFDKDMCCRGFQYNVGETYETDNEIELCKHGFHFCRKMLDVFRYYNNTDCRYAEVEALGDIIEGEDKCVTNKIKIIREISRHDAVDMSNSSKYNSGYGNSGECNTGHYNIGDWNSGNFNSGDYNSGNWNSGNYNSGYGNSGKCNTGHYNIGDRNSGNFNTGDYNSGNCNSGHCNSGDWNSGRRNSGDYNSGRWNSGNHNSGDWNAGDNSSGCFCTENHFFIFDRESDWNFARWRKSRACQILNRKPSMIVEWINSSDMTEEEKEQKPEYETTGGYLKVMDDSDAAQEWWDGLDEADKEEVLSLPNFDAEKFKRCTGIRV